MALMEKNEDWTVKGIADRIVKLNESKETQYTVDVIGKLDEEVWLAQILVKAARAYYSKDREKTIEEVLDMMTYGALYIEKVKR